MTVVSLRWWWKSEETKNATLLISYGELEGAEKNINMVKHIILWTLNPELSEEEKAQVKLGIKEGLEGLKGKVPGLIDVVVNISGRLASSNCDVMLDSTLENAEALKAYAIHPAHVAVADTKVRPYTVQRTCLDFEV